MLFTTEIADVGRMDVVLNRVMKLVRWEIPVNRCGRAEATSKLRAKCRSRRGIAKKVLDTLRATKIVCSGDADIISLCRNSKKNCVLEL